MFFEKTKAAFPGRCSRDAGGSGSVLEDCMAVVAGSVREVWEYFDEAGIDLEGADEEEILNADEVFDIGDGRYLIVEG